VGRETRGAVHARRESLDHTSRVRELTKLLRSGLPSVRVAAAAQLAEIQRSRLLLLHEDASAGTSGMGLGRQHHALPPGEVVLTSREEQRLAQVATMLQNPNWTIRIAALAALADAGAGAAAVASRVGELLEDPEGKVRAAARETLRCLAPVNAGEVYIDQAWGPKSLLAVLPPPDEAGERRGELPAPTVRSIMADLEDSRFAVRKAALAALGELFEHAARQSGGFYARVAVEKLGDPHIAVRQAAVAVLHRSSPEAKPGVAASLVERMHQASEPRLKRACLQAITSLGLSQIRDHRADIEAMLQDADYGVGKAAHEAMRRLDALVEVERAPQLRNPGGQEARWYWNS
jgi:HEAT repeat protein